MSPYPLVSPTEEEEQKEGGLGVPVETPPKKSPEQPARLEPPHPVVAPRGRNWLTESLLEMSTTRPPKRTWDFVFAFSAEALFIVVLILLPLIFTQAIDLKQFTATYLVAPPPPPPPPPPPATNVIQARVPNRRVFTQAGHLVAPTAIPTTVAMLKEESLPPEVGITGVEGGVPGGVPGGQVGGVLGSILQENVKNFQPAPPTSAARTKPLRVGGNVKAPQSISSAPPVYPALARQAKIQGTVRINAIIDAQGSVVEMKVISGHALLIQAALDAVSRWKYRPTILNGEPVPVELEVTVNFSLN